MTPKKGFTLVELLVVIGIIGILTSIVFVYLGVARDRAKDARIQADLSQVRSIAESINDDQTSYDTLCDTANNTLNNTAAANNYITQLTTIENDINDQQLGAAVLLTCYVGGTPEVYCVEAELISSGVGYYCIDSKGIAKVNSVAQCTAAGSVCTP